MWFEKYEDVLTDEGKIICDLTTLFMNKDKEIERLQNIIETYKDANEYHQNKIKDLEKLLRKTPSQLISENVYLRAKNNKLNNIIDEALGIANERVNYYHHKKMETEDWTEIFDVLVKRDNLELKEGNKDVNV